MTAEIVRLCSDAHGRSATKRIARRDAARRLVAAAWANGLSPITALTEENIALVAELNLFPEYEQSSDKVRKN